MIFDHFVGTPSGSMASTLPKTRARKNMKYRAERPPICCLTLYLNTCIHILSFDVFFFMSLRSRFR